MSETYNLLDKITEGRTLPEGFDAWAIKSTRPDLTTKHGFRWPFPGNSTGRFELDADNWSSCPRRDGDGVCVALDWRGMASGGFPARTLLLVAYRKVEAMADDVGKLRVPEAFVVDLLDGEALLKDAGNANLQGANLQGADLWGAKLQGANLRGADLWDANLWGANLQGADLWGADLWDANLWGANLQGADLWGAKLQGANLRGADLWGADLWGAKLQGANLQGANLRDADLRDANLWGANLQGAKLQGANGFDREDAKAKGAIL